MSQSQSGDPIRVVHLVRTLDVGGLEMVVLDLVRKATRSIFEPIVVCLGSAGELAPRFEAVGVRVVSLEGESVKLPQAVGRLAKLLRSLKPQILHTHNPGPHLQGALATLMTRIPVLVHTKHGPELHRQSNSSCHEPTRLLLDQSRGASLRRFSTGCA